MYIGLFLSIISLSSYALVEFEDATSPELIKSPRAQAMGGAFLSNTDDGWSAFYNPAGLGSVRKFQFHLLNAAVETNKGFIDVTSGSGSFFDSFSNYTDSFEAEGIKKLLEGSEKTSLARFQLFPNITYRNFSLGYMYVQQYLGRTNTASNTFEFAQRRDSGPVAAFNVPLFGGVLKFGLSGVLLNRKEVQKDFLLTDTVELGPEDYKEGTMAYLTAGFRLTLPMRGLPSLSVVHRNAAGKSWHDLEGGGEPDSIEQSTDLALSITPIFSRMVRVHLEVVKRDITDRYKDVSDERKLNAGLEIGYMRKAFVRLGLSDGWGSGGFGIRTRKFIFDLTTYAVERGDEFREKEDRRFVLGISSGI